MTLEARLKALEERVRQLEDRAEILQLMATYGPAVDSCNGDIVAELWTEDGHYRTDGLDFAGREELAALVELPGHRQYVDAGSAHVLSLPHLVIEDDRAVATGYSRVYVVQGDGHRVARTSANRWELVRTAGGWRVQSRINRRLTGAEEARQLLHAAVAGGDDPAVDSSPP